MFRDMSNTCEVQPLALACVVFFILLAYFNLAHLPHPIQAARLEWFSPLPWEMFTIGSDGDDNTFDYDELVWRDYPCRAVAIGERC